MSLLGNKEVIDDALTACLAAKETKQVGPATKGWLCPFVVPSWLLPESFLFFFLKITLL